MANTGQPNSAGSQFFIVLDDAVDQQLGKTYAIFGTVTDGMDVVDKIAAGPTSGQTAMDPVVMAEGDRQAPVTEIRSSGRAATSGGFHVRRTQRCGILTMQLNTPLESQGDCK